MRLRWIMTVAFIALAVVQVLVVVPFSLRNLRELMEQNQLTRISEVMRAVAAEHTRSNQEMHRIMDELQASTALEDVARDAAMQPPPSLVTQAAQSLMKPRGLDVLAILDDHGRTLSSGHLPARLGEPDDPLFMVTRLAKNEIVTLLIDFPSSAGLQRRPVMVTARSIDYGEQRVWAVGGFALDHDRAALWAQLTGARVRIFAGDEKLVEAGGAEEPFLERNFKLEGDIRAQFLFSQREQLLTQEQVFRGFMVLTALGLLVSIAIGAYVSQRVTSPVEALTDAAKKIAGGAPGAIVETSGGSKELSELITTFNQMTHDLKVATDKLLTSERIAAWQEVARRLAHEIKNPLTPIRMSLETLLAASQRGPVDERFMGIFKESAHAVLEEVDRLKRIVDEFSQFARLPRPSLAPMNLSEAAHQVMSLYAPHDGLRYITEFEPGLLISGDRDQLTQVLVNLVKNAEEAMAPQGGGTVTVRTFSSGRDAVLEVTDSGPGIPAGLKARLFEPYVTSKPQGTGLGLAIALRIAQEHEGRLVADDAANTGARFRLSLPRVSDR